MDYLCEQIFVALLSVIMSINGKEKACSARHLLLYFQRLRIKIVDRGQRMGLEAVDYSYL